MSARTARCRSLAGRLAAGEARAVVTFAGQGVDVLDELAALVAQRPELRPASRWATEVLDARSRRSDLGAGVAAPTGTASTSAAWVMDPDGAPPAAYLRGAAVSYPLRLLAQALLWRALWADALGDAVRAGSIVALAGHSQGLLAALLVGRGARRRDRRRAARAAPRARRGPGAAHGRGGGRALADGGDRRRHARRGWSRCSADGVTVALVNTPTRLVVAGAPAALDVLRARLAEQAAARGGRAARRAPRRRAAALRVVAAARSTCRSTRPRWPSRWRASRRGSARATPTWAPVLGVGAATGARAVRRAGALGRGRGEIRALGADWVLDLGPGTARRAADGREPARQRRAHARAGLARGPARADLARGGARRARRRRTRRSRRGWSRCPAAAAPRHALHARHRPPAGDPGRDDADDGRRADRRRRRERGLHGRAGRRRAAGPADVRAARRGAGGAAGAGPRGRLQHAAARPAPVGAAHLRATRCCSARGGRARRSRG